MYSQIRHPNTNKFQNIDNSNNLLMQYIHHLGGSNEQMKTFLLSLNRMIKENKKYPNCPPPATRKKIMKYLPMTIKEINRFFKINDITLRKPLSIKEFKKDKKNLDYLRTLLISSGIVFREKELLAFYYTFKKQYNPISYAITYKHDYISKSIEDMILNSDKRNFYFLHRMVNDVLLKDMYNGRNCDIMHPNNIILLPWDYKQPPPMFTNGMEWRNKKRNMVHWIEKLKKKKKLYNVFMGNRLLYTTNISTIMQFLNSNKIKIKKKLTRCERENDIKNITELREFLLGSTIVFTDEELHAFYYKFKDELKTIYKDDLESLVDDKIKDFIKEDTRVFINTKFMDRIIKENIHPNNIILHILKDHKDIVMRGKKWRKNTLNIPQWMNRLSDIDKTNFKELHDKFEKAVEDAKKRC